MHPDTNSVENNQGQSMGDRLNADFAQLNNDRYQNWIGQIDLSSCIGIQPSHHDPVQAPSHNAMTLSQLHGTVKRALSTQYFAGRDVRLLVKNSILLRKVIAVLASRQHTDSNRQPTDSNRQHTDCSRQQTDNSNRQPTDCSSRQQTDSSILLDMMDMKQPFYKSFYSAEEYMKDVLRYREEGGNGDVDDLYSSIECVYNAEDKLGVILGRWMSRMVWENCISPNNNQYILHKSLVSLLLARMPDAVMRNEVVARDTSLFHITEHQYTRMQKQELENYCRSLITLCSEATTAEMYVFPLITKNLREENSIEKKVLGFRMMGDMIVQSRHMGGVIRKWLAAQEIVPKYCKEGTQSQILKKLPPIVRFMYEENALSIEEVMGLIEQSLHGGPQLFEIGSSLAHSLRLQDMEHVLCSIQGPQFMTHPYYQAMISSIASNPHLHSSVLKEEDESLSKRIVMSLFMFLMRGLDSHLSVFLLTVNRLITAHYQVVREHLLGEIILQLRAGKTHAPWLIEHACRVEKECYHERSLVERLTAEGLYEYMLAMLARNRFNRPITDQIIAVLSFLCTHRPLQKNHVEFLWRALGLHSTEEREREQFFLFVKDVLRVEHALTEQSVHYVYFEVLLKLHANWYSLRIYECFEGLFLRLNEDCHLLVYERESYIVVDCDLIGLEKMWYLYFNGGDARVVKKCRDFLGKLVRFENGERGVLIHKYVSAVVHHLQHAFQLVDSPLLPTTVQRAFELIEKMLQHPKEQGVEESKIRVVINNCLPYALLPRRREIEIMSSLTLERLREVVCDKMQIEQKSIGLITKGKTLQGQLMTVAELKIDNGQTIMVQEEERDEEKKSKVMGLIKSRIIEMFGESLKEPFVDYIVGKCEGDTVENVINYLLDEGNLTILQQQFDIAQAKKALPVFAAEGKTQVSFAKALMSDEHNVDLLLKSTTIVESRKTLWDIVRRLPPNPSLLHSLREHISKQDWQAVFMHSEEKCLYNLYLLTLQMRGENSHHLLLEECNLRLFLTQYLDKLIKSNCKHYLLIEQVILLLTTALDSPPLKHFDEFLSLPHSQMEIEYPSLSSFITVDMCQSMCAYMLTHPLPHSLALSFLKVLLYHLHYPDHHGFSVLEMEKHTLRGLLIKYGRCMQYYIVESARKAGTGIEVVGRVVRELNEDMQMDGHIVSAAYYQCIAQLIGLCPQLDYQGPLITTITNRVQYHVSDLSEGEMSGSLLILAALLKKNNSIGNLLVFGEWLFSGYLFQLQEPRPYFRNKVIRKTAFAILKELCRDGRVMERMVRSIRELPTVSRGEQERDVDFRENEFIGLRNLGATCYVNSLLQQLYHTRLPTRIMEEDNSEREGVRMYELKHVFMSLFRSIKSFINPQQFIRKMTLNGEVINPRVQQDASQFLMSLFEYIEQEGGKVIKDEIFGGSLWNEITGLEEESTFIKTNSQSFTTISVDIKGRRNLQEALTYFTKGEVLQNQNMYFSEELGRKTRAMKKTYLATLPDILIVTLKRFQFDHETMSRHKLNDYFEFPTELDVRAYCCAAKRDNPLADPNEFKFRLAGILVHSGSAESGHYYSYISVGDKWYEFNDRSVYDFNLGVSLKTECFGGNEERTRSAYILFYEKLNAKTHGVHLHTLAPQNRISQAVKRDNLAFLRSRLFFELPFFDFISFLLKENKDLHKEFSKFTPLYLQPVAGYEQIKEKETTQVGVQFKDVNEFQIQEQKDNKVYNNANDYLQQLDKQFGFDRLDQI